jgi:hypothetical protein
MQRFSGANWSRPSFKRRLKMLKGRRWVGIVGQPGADLARAPKGSMFEATEIAPGTPSQSGLDWVPAADVSAERAKELLQRFRKGRASCA